MTSVCSVIYKLPGYRDRSTPAASIFFHLADQNLEDYMTSDSRPNPKDDLERLCILRQMLALSQGLQWLNQERQQYGSGRAYCHNDLKPQNILVFGNPDHPETLRFKITDFGEACQPQPQQGGPDPFERPGTYHAPEGIGRPKSDAWSFGCIFLMLLVFNHLHGGAEGVAIFEKMRQEKYEPISRFPSRGDFFYQRSAKPLISDGCNKAVTDYLTRFPKAIQESKLDSKSIYHRLTLAIYPYIQNSILQPHDRRDDIRTISAKLSSLYTESSKLPIITTPLKGISKKPEKSCFSPDGTVVYYRPDMIMLRNLETNQSRDLEPRTLKNSWSERIWFRPAACSNDSIALVLSKDNTGLTRFEVRGFIKALGNTLVEPCLIMMSSRSGISRSFPREGLSLPFDLTTK